MKKCCFAILLALLLALATGCDKDSSVAESAPPGDILPAATGSYSFLPQTSQTTQLPPSEQPEATDIRILTPALADDLDFAVYSEGIFCISNGNYGEGEMAGKYGYMLDDGTEITECIYDYAYPFSDGLACVRIHGKYGFIDTNGKTALPSIYDSAAPFSEGLAYFEQGESYGFIDHTGNPAFFLDCDSVSSFQEGLAFISIDGKYGFIDNSGEIVISPVFDDAGFFKNGLAKVRVGLTYGFIDKAGTFVVQPEYEDVTVDGEYFLVKSKGMYGAIDRDGKTVLPSDYSYVELVSGHNAAIVNTGDGEKIIGLDETGQSSTTYDYLICDRRSDLILAYKGNKCGFLSTSDFTVVIPIIYDSAASFVGDFAAVSFEGRYGVIDRLGNVVVPYEYDSIKVFPNETFAGSIMSKWRLIDSKGEAISDTVYSSIQQTGDGYTVELENKSGFWDASGEEVIPYKYDYCFQWVYGADNCFIVNEGYGPQSHSIVALGEIQGSDLSHILLRNEITPKIKPYSRFLKDGFFETDYNEDGSPPFQESISELNGFLHYYKLYKVGSGAPVMYYYARPFQQSGFPRSYSGFYAVKDGRLNTLTTGYECGGSMGGDCICFWQDSKTLEIYIGTYYHVGGFGGHAYGGNVYKHKNGTAVPIISFDYVDQSARNYDESDLLKSAHLFYDIDDVAYTKDTILQAAEDYGYVIEYSVNEKRTTAEAYHKTTDRYKMLILWGWDGY